MDPTQIVDYSEAESPKIRKEKDSVILLNERYNTPNTSLLLFHFEPHPYTSSDLRLKNGSILHHAVEGRDIYIFDDFFLESEQKDLRNYSRNASFSRSSYASQESREKGEEPAHSMNNKEKWDFFNRPPDAIKEIYKLLGTFAHQINASITTLPWDICDQNICASAVATNKLEKVSKESMERGKHEDFNTEKGIPFGIPILHQKEKTYFPSKFANGTPSNPWLISLMVYATEDNFLVPDFGIGTMFYKKNGEFTLKADCRHTRFVLFDGDILHSIEESKIPFQTNSWRVSYVFKLIINPKEAHKSMRTAFYEFLKTKSVKNL